MNNTNSQIEQTPVFLVSGGAKGITAQCVIELAKHKKCKFILLGSSSIAQPEPKWAIGCSSESKHKEFNAISSRQGIEKTLSTIEQAGGQAEYLSVDVTDAIALQEKLAVAVEHTGPITGIIHGAGNLAELPIEKESQRDFETVYNAKVKGLENLLSCVSASQLDYLILFDSVVGFYGNVGQSDYAIANEILNKSAYLVKRNHPNCHVVIINWEPWESGGTKILVDELEPANQEVVQVAIGSPLVPTPVPLNLDLQTFQIHRRLTLAANPFLQDHLIGDRPVLPATYAVAWIVNTCEQLYPGYNFFSCANFKVLKQIVFDNTLASEYVLELKELAKTNDREIEFGAKVWSKTKSGKIRYHFSTQLKLMRQIPVAPTYDSFNCTLEQTILSSKASFYHTGESTLFHGPDFQGVESVLNISTEKITLQCALPSIGERQQGQFPVQTLNPYIADVQINSTWIWLQHFYQQGCLTSIIKKFEHFIAIPFGETFYVSCEVKFKTETALVADIIAHNRQGQIYSRMLGAKSTILPLKSRRR